MFPQEKPFLVLECNPRCHGLMQQRVNNKLISDARKKQYMEPDSLQIRISRVSVWAGRGTSEPP